MKCNVLAAVVFVLALCSGARVASAQVEPETFFKTKIGLSAGDIQKIDHGQVVTKVLDSADKKYGILVFGGVYINASIEQFVASYCDVRNLLTNNVYRDVQESCKAGAPPKLSDFDRLTFDRKDVDALQKCKPHHCDLQVFDVESFQKQMDWNSKDKYDQANRLARRRIYEGMTRYLAGGLKALGSYTDREKPFDLYQNIKSMLDSSFYLPQDDSGGIYQHLLDYPEGQVPGAMDFYYWEDIDFGQGPTIRVNRASLFPKGAGFAKYAATNEQLYASRYIRIALQMFFCVPDTRNPDRPGFYLIEMNDSRIPDFTGLKLGAVRRIATSKGVASTRDILNLHLRKLSGAGSVR